MLLENLQTLLTRYKSGFGLEQPFYTSGEILAAEWEKIWKHHWIYAGNLAQIKKSGDYFLYKINQDEIIIIKGNDEMVHAHYNTCTHRGSAICLEGKGHASKLICPYHQWVFDKDGKLLNARMMPEDFCKEEYNLRSVAVEVVEGLIFISLTKDPPSFSKIRESLTPFVKTYNISEAKIACHKNYTLRANWKLIAENFRECYHCGAAHPEYCSAVIGANLREDTSDLTNEKNKVWSEKGLATELIEVTPGTTTYAIRYPLRPGIESYSTDGKKVSIPMGHHQDHDAGVIGLVNYPNLWVDAVSDYMWTMRITPIDASTTDVEFCWLVDGKAEEGKDYDLKHLTDFWEITGEQDGRLCENNFKGIESSAYRPGPYAAVEDQVVNFVDWCVMQLQSK